MSVNSFLSIKKKIYNLIFSILVILLLFSSSFIVLSTLHDGTNDSTASEEIMDEGQNFEISNIHTSISSQRIIRNGGSVNSDAFSLGTSNFQFSPTLETELKSSSTQFDFNYNETYTNGINLTSNNHTISPPLISPYDEYDRINMTIKTASYKETIVMEGSANDSQGLDVNTVSAQAGFIPGLNISGSAANIDGFSVANNFASSNFVVTGELWNATTRSGDGAIIPHKMLSSTSVNTNPTNAPRYYFSLPSNVTISSSDTHINDTGGFVFFVFHHSSSGEFWSMEIQDKSPISAPTYRNTTAGSPPTNEEYWGPEQNYDFTLDFNSSVVYNSDNVGVKVASPAGTTGIATTNNGKYINTTTITSQTTYEVFSQDDFLNSLNFYFNISYTLTLNLADLTTSVNYITNPGDSNIQWNIYYDNTNFPKDTNSSRYFLLPKNFTNIELYYNETLQELNSSTYIIPDFDATHQALLMEDPLNFGLGNYTILANSTNLFNGVNMETFRDNGGGWESANNATMGELYPVQTDGDKVKANATVSFDLGTNNVNASLRTETGQILTNYSLLVDNLHYDKILNDSIPIGVWSFQFRWTNGTAAAAMAIEFAIYPVTIMEFEQPTESLFLEAANMSVVVRTRDNSHDSNWSDASYIEWELGQKQLVYTSEDTVNHWFYYETFLNLSVSANPVQPSTTYTINATLEERSGFYTQSIQISFTVYYRADGDIVKSINYQYGDDLDFDFAPRNLTGDGLPFDTTNSVTFNNLQYTNENVSKSIPISKTYDNPYYNFTVSWDSDFIIGTDNQFDLTWTLTDFREVATVASITTTFNLTIVDGDSPIFTDTPDDDIPLDNTINESTSINYWLNWTVTDEFNGTYEIRVDTVLDDSGSWSSGEPITYNLGPSGLLNGTHNIEITVQDKYGNPNSHDVTLIVLDEKAPTLRSRPTNQNISSQQFLYWNFTDNHPNSYNVLRDGNPWQNGDWTNSDFIAVDISAMPEGVNTIQITVSDDNGNEIVDTFEITIDRTAPQITQSPSSNSISYELGSSGNQINWTVNDVHPDNYTVYQDGNVLIDNVMWNDGDLISIDIDGLMIGSHNFTILVADSYSNMNLRTVIVDVVDTTPPSLSDFEMGDIYDNATDVELTWTASDLSPGRYFIYRNSELIVNETWSGDISYTITDYTIGQNINYTIVVFDQSGNSASDQVIFDIKDHTITETNSVDLGLPDQVYEGDIYQINGTWTTSISGDGIENANVEIQLVRVGNTNQVVFTYSTSTNAQGEYSLLFNHSRLAPGDYIWTITFTKDNFQTQQYQKQLTVFPHTVSISLSYPGRLRQGQEFVILVQVNYTTFDNIQLYNLIHRNSGGVVGVNVSITISYINTEGIERELPVFGLTDNNGEALIRLLGSDTQSITQITGITSDVVGASYISSPPQEEPEENLPDVEQSDVEFEDWVSLTINFLNEYWEIILGALAGIIILISLISRRLKQRRRRMANLHQELENAAEEVKGLISIQAIILKNSETGIPFYYQTFEEEEASLDASLISSLTTAISSFLSELQSGVSGFETMERQGITITSHRSTNSDFIVISKKPLPLVFFEQIENAHAEVELTYNDDIQNPLMIQEIPEDAIVETLKKNNFKIDLKGFLNIEAKGISKLKHKGSISRAIRSNLEFINEFANMTETANVPVTLSSLIDFLISKGLNMEMSSKLVLVSYNHDIISKEGSFND